MRRRMENAFDHFLDMRQSSDDAVVRQLAALDIDILADLNGHTYGGRPGIAARRAAPVQVNFLGYPGSMGADFFDYVIGDETVLPNAQQRHYREKIVHLPGCYQVNSRRMVAQSHSSRADCGLPEQGFVFCCFNNSWKISAPLFAVWMRLLYRLPQSVLWLMAGEETAAHLRRAAEAQGIDPRRLVFAPRLSQGEHLARHRHADLFLDTLPYNAHTTASDALWMGVPLVTCLGTSFAGRAAASVLKTTGLPELVTASLDEYEALALRLAQEPLLLQSFRDRLARPQTNPLFDSARFCRKLETAYEKMMVLARAGELPRGFAVTE
jgi:predicted O-linked N-acetylglucosamine transferase (SPINDLY family)